MTKARQTVLGVYPCFHWAFSSGFYTPVYLHGRACVTFYLRKDFCFSASPSYKPTKDSTWNLHACIKYWKSLLNLWRSDLRTKPLTKSKTSNVANLMTSDLTTRSSLNHLFAFRFYFSDSPCSPRTARTAAQPYSLLDFAMKRLAALQGHDFLDTGHITQNGYPYLFRACFDDFYPFSYHFI